MNFRHSAFQPLQGRIANKVSDRTRFCMNIPQTCSVPYRTCFQEVRWIVESFIKPVLLREVQAKLPPILEHCKIHARWLQETSRV